MPCMQNNELPKKALDQLIKKSRVHLYKPIQIAEILYHHRNFGKIRLDDLPAYRNLSKKWRDEVSISLVGRRSTSSQKYQDNLFEANAMPPELLVELGKFNKKKNGAVEAYIYKALEARLNSVRKVESYIENSTPKDFSLTKLVSFFQASPGLRRSVDKMYEILVYALFATLVRALEATVKIEIGNQDPLILKDFGRFVELVLGIDAEKTNAVYPAALYRVGVTNAADRGLDMWANFGPAIQVKHLTLTPELVEDIAEGISADKIVIVCLDAEKNSIESLTKQVGWDEVVQGIVTLENLDEWYKLCLGTKYRKSLGQNLLRDLSREFESEFPSGREVKPFMESRGYHSIVLPTGWEVQI